MSSLIGSLFVLLAVTVGASAVAIPTEVGLQCPASEAVCKVVWTLSQVQTMMIYEDGLAYPVVYKDGNFQQRDSCDVYTGVNIDLSLTINQDSGEQKFVYAVNNNSPGGTLTVYENQTLEISVYNNFVQDSTGIHWHGMWQIGTPWMDGVTSVTQCPINLQETFVYRFQPQPSGTHWYHSHTALQRTDGLFGALIILPVEERTDLPTFDKDFLAMVHDWYPTNSVYHFYAAVYGFSKYLKGGFDGTCEDYPVATIINGIGYLGTGDMGVDFKGATTYIVTQGNHYRIRFLNSGLETAYLVQIQQHKMTVIASDGRPLTPYTVDSLVIHIGERFDVNITADQSVDSYWISFTKLSTGLSSRTVITGQYSTGYAVLLYDGADGTNQPSDNPTACTSQAKCQVGNCPFEAFDDTSLNYECTNIGDLRSTDSVLHEGDIEEFFLVFGFTEAIQGIDSSRASINAIHFTVPSTPPVVAREVTLDRPCGSFDCANEPCLCTHMIQATYDKVVQLVFASTSDAAHPIHLHGYDYQVIKVAYGDISVKDTPFKVNPDIDCQTVADNAPRCTNPTWTNSTWLNGNVPGIITENPPEKDTVIVPAGGYVVVRIKANNRGFWMLHCHIEFHLEEGMGLIFQVGEPEDLPAPPTGFATCGSFPYNEETTTTATTESVAAGLLGGATVLVIGALALATLLGHGM